MRCDEANRLIGNTATVGTADRQALHAHLAECEQCLEAYEAHAGIPDACAALGQAGDAAVSKAGQIVRDQIAIERRQSALAIVGVAVACVGAIWFIGRGDPFGSFALVATVLVMGFRVWLGRQREKEFAAAPTGPSLWRRWQQELTAQIRQLTVHGPLIAVMFSALTVFVLARHGMTGKGLIYLLTCLAINAFVLHRLLVKVPELKRERAMVEAHHLGE